MNSTFMIKLNHNVAIDDVLNPPNISSSFTYLEKGTTHPNVSCFESLEHFPQPFFTVLQCYCVGTTTINI